MTKATLMARIEAVRVEGRRGVNLTVRLSGPERDRLHQVAAGVGLPASVLARLLLLDGLDELEGGGEAGAAVEAGRGRRRRK